MCRKRPCPCPKIPETHPILASEILCDPSKIFQGSAKRVEWRCSICEHKWKAEVRSRANGGGCPVCSNRVIHKDGRNSMTSTHPELASEYQGDASKIVTGTNKKLPWKCNVCDHEWKTSGSHRLNGKGCPVCKNGVLHSDGGNSLQVLNPILAAECLADPTKYTIGSSSKVEWKCSECFHEWATTVAHRAISGTGCPACANQSLHIDGRNSMLITHPNLATELLGEDASTVIAGTNRKLSWMCSICSYEWVATGNSRAFSATGCPACSNRVVHSDGRNSLAVLNAELASECLEDPNKYTLGSVAKVGWRCHDCSHEWVTAVVNRAISGSGCPACNSGVLHSDGRNSLLTTHHELSLEILDCDPSTIVSGSHRKSKWRCSICTHEWMARINSRSAQGAGCPVCNSGALHNDGRNSLAVMNPGLASECLDDPRKYTLGSGSRIPWKCNDCSHEWITSVRHRAFSGTGCPACANQVLHMDGRNSMLYTHPNLAEELLHADPSKLIAGTPKKMKWKCNECSHVWQANSSSRSKGIGCPACNSGALHSDGRNSMQETHPKLASELLDVDPTKITAGTKRRLRWKCVKCEHEWVNDGGSRVSGRGCPACANIVLHLHGKNSMQSTHPELAKEYLGDATKIVAGVRKSLDWKCVNCGHEWKSTGDNRVRGRGCPSCSPVGFQPNKPGCYYVLVIKNLDKDVLYYKGGITNNIERRISEISRSLPTPMSINFLEKIDFELGQDARDLESKLLRIDSIRAPVRSFDGGNELFLENPVKYAREQNLVDC
jgi:Zn finger protein HypA/HybF involved in hydrogenase expression